MSVATCCTLLAHSFVLHAFAYLLPEAIALSGFTSPPKASMRCAPSFDPWPGQPFQPYLRPLTSQRWDGLFPGGAPPETLGIRDSDGHRAVAMHASPPGTLRLSSGASYPVTRLETTSRPQVGLR